MKKENRRAGKKELNKTIHGFHVLVRIILIFFNNT